MSHPWALMSGLESFFRHLFVEVAHERAPAEMTDEAIWLFCYAGNPAQGDGEQSSGK